MILKLSRINSLLRGGSKSGIGYQGITTDNGFFNALDFIEDLLKKHQNIRIIGYGVSNKNGHHIVPFIYWSL